MRTVRDGEARLWDVAVAQASYGAHYLVFSARVGGELRKSALAATTRLDAERELRALSEDELRTCLREAEPWG